MEHSLKKCPFCKEFSINKFEFAFFYVFSNFRALFKPEKLFTSEVSCHDDQNSKKSNSNSKHTLGIKIFCWDGKENSDPNESKNKYTIAMFGPGAVGLSGKFYFESETLNSTFCSFPHTVIN